MVTPPEPITGRPLALLYLVAAPLVTAADQGITPVVALDSQAELDAIADACTLRSSPLAVTIQPLVATTELVGHVLATQRTPPDILHFTGHGTAPTDGSALIFEDADGAARRVDRTTFQALLAPLGHAPCQLAFLSACHSEGMASVLLEAGVRHVVAVNADDTVLDHAAHLFAQRLYPSLLAGRTVAEAFAFARTAVLADDTLTRLYDRHTFQPVNLREAAKFQLLPADDKIHHQPLTWPATAGTVTFDTARWERTNLDQAQRDPFIGRIAERYELGRALRNQRCVHLDGYGGMGKTALARVVGRWLHERSRWMDGVWMVELRHVTTVAQARLAIALALKFEPSTSESNASLVAALGHQERLLILDDLDALLTHDRTATATLLNTLLTAHRIQLLTTSRRTLPGGVHHHRIAITRLMSHDALMAFRAYAGDPTQWGPHTGADVAQLMKFLDGYPFPLRLAAAYMLQTRCGLQRLLERLTLNPQGTYRYPHDDEDRTTSLAATLDLSYGAMMPDQQQLFAHLSLFPGGILRNVIPLVFGEEAAAHAETLLAHSLVEYRTIDGDERFLLPEPARRYAEARLPADALATIAPNALQALLEIAMAGDKMLLSMDASRGQQLLTLEMPNFRQFLLWGKDNETSTTEFALTARIGSQLINYWSLVATTHTIEPLILLGAGICAAARLNDRLGEANTRLALGDVQRMRDDYREGMVNYEIALGLYQEIGDDQGHAHTRLSMGEIQRMWDSHEAAMVNYKTALLLYKTINDRLGEANTMHSIGELHRIQRETCKAITSYECALELYLAVNERRGEANTRRSIGDVQRMCAEYEKAMESYKLALELYQTLNDRRGEANTWQAIGDVYKINNMYEKAMINYEIALGLYQMMGERIGEANTQQSIGEVYRMCAEYDKAMEKYEIALGLYQTIDDRLGKAHTYLGIGDSHRMRAEYDKAMESYEIALGLYQTIDDRLGKAHAQRSIGDIYLIRTLYDDAIRYYKVVLEIYKIMGDSRGEGHTWRSIGEAQRLREEYKESIESCRIALGLYQSIGDQLGEANAWLLMAESQRMQEEYEDAISNYKIALERYKNVNSKSGEADTRLGIGMVQRIYGDIDGAMSSYEIALALYQKTGNHSGEATVLVAMAQCLLFPILRSVSWLNQASEIRTKMKDWRNLGAGLADYANSLVQHGHPFEALDYFQRARSVLVDHDINELIPQIDKFIENAVTIILSELPNTVRDAVGRRDENSLTAALAELLPDEAWSIISQLQAIGVLDLAVPPEIQAVIVNMPATVRNAIVQGDRDELNKVLTALPPDDSASIRAELQSIGILDQTTSRETLLGVWQRFD